MKKVFSLILSLAMLLSISACNSTPSSSPNPAVSTPSPSTGDTSTPPKTDTPTTIKPDNYPVKPITFTVAANAGGGLDIVSRIAAKYLQSEVGVNVNIENNAAGSGAVAHTTVATGPKDGYNMMLITNSAIMDSYLRTDCYYSLESFTPIATVDVSPVVLVVKTGGEMDISLDEIITRAATEDLSMGIGLNWKASDYARLMLMEETGVYITKVAYSGSGTEAAAAVASGEIDMAFVYPNECVSYVQSGELTCIAVTSDERFPGLPDVPTLQELNYNVPNLVLRRCIAIASGTDQAVVDYLNATFETILNNKDVVEEYSAAGVEVAYANAADTLAQLQADYNTYYEFLSSHNIEAGGVAW